ncbi:hypothetical protein [Micromonospora sp. NPDC048898]|uniref:DUF7878 domain-containing protein n=1 Tax=Micromonospora sp. NPDC048898 TaxID=3364260 RepID=UPI00371DC1D7
MLEFRYRNFNSDDLQGTSIAEYLVNLEADLQINADGLVVYEELAFPVVELARDLIAWCAGGAMERGEDFVFESLSFDETGAVTIRMGLAGWSIGSVFVPDSFSRQLPAGEIAAAVQVFADDLRREIGSRGFDPSLLPSSEAEVGRDSL